MPSPMHDSSLSIVLARPFPADSGHVDCEENDRAATLLIYLSDVPDGAGGRTMFPGLSVSVRPQKGRVLLWRNLDAKGRCMKSTEHSAEPIADYASGQKVILQRWYHSRRSALINLPKLPLALVGANPRSPQIVCPDVSKCRRYD